MWQDEFENNLSKSKVLVDGKDQIIFAERIQLDEDEMEEADKFKYLKVMIKANERSGKS